MNKMCSKKKTNKYVGSLFKYYKGNDWAIDKIYIKIGGQVDTTPPYSGCQVGHCNGCVKFEFNDISLYMNNVSEWTRPNITA